jgi:SOS-response transcriptional repressor LexA
MRNAQAKTRSRQRSVRRAIEKIFSYDGRKGKKIKSISEEIFALCMYFCILCIHFIIMELTLYESVPAGLPFTPETSPGTPLDISAYLIEHPASSYLVRVRGDSME